MTDAARIADAFDGRIAIPDPTSIHPFSTVYKAAFDGPDGERDAVVKQTWSEHPEALAQWLNDLDDAGVGTVAPLADAVDVDGENWVAYPWIEGRSWDGSSEDLRAAGRLLGAIHAASKDLEIENFDEFQWGNPAAESIEEDADALRASASVNWPDADPGHWINQLEGFPALLAAVRDVDLPTYPVSLDHRAANLVFTDDGAVAVDLENAAVAPRIFDVAVAVLLFPLEHPASGGDALDHDQWAAFLDGYLETAPPLTDVERRVWPIALTYMKLEWGTWHLTEGVEDEPGNLSYLEDLLTLDENERYALT